ncbi:uncharacterized protein IUM83_19908 [Phytophthora cinnamomi]|uniref:uncharacterized protein n=1 Tax=Phytophthora cinnamomi TaxID=4785 RepID=UPI00355964B2|nr:hypothetical protein IUM83_19908 [Phytophthora cinnamomi]
MLGGSNNLVSERNRRDKAEAALQTARLNLCTLAQDLTPQVQRLAQQVEALQVEKRHRLQLDEASQELLEGLQGQIDDVEARQQQCCVVDCRIENAVKHVDEQATADRYELRMLISKLQEVQDKHAVEIRLLHQEEFMAQRMNAIEDAVASVRTKSHHALKKEVATRLQDRQVCCDQMVTKTPSELSKRLQKAQTV